MNLYDKLQEILPVEVFRLSASLFSDDSKNQLDTEEKSAFELLKNISSISVNVLDNGVEFAPLIIMNGQRSFSVEDLTDKDYELLDSLELKKIPLDLRALIADILWTQKKDYKAASVAAETYYELFNLWFDDNNWVGTLDAIKRAICISAQIGKTDLHKEYCDTLFNHIIRLNGQDKDYLSIALIRIILFQSYDSLNEIIDILDTIISLSKDNPNKSEQAYELKAQCLNKLKQPESAKKSNVEMADYFVEFAESVVKSEAQGALRAKFFFDKAIFAYRNNGEPQQAEKTHKRLVEVQKDIPKLMVPISTTIDIKAIVDGVSEKMKGLSFEESIIMLSKMVSFYKKDEFKKKVLDAAKTNPLSLMFPNSILNDEGQTVFSLPGLNLSNPEENPQVLNDYIHREMHQDQSLSGGLSIRYALLYIKEHFDIDKEKLDFLINDNLVIPTDRTEIIRSAIVMALKGQFYESLHILAPQTEKYLEILQKN